MDTLLQALDWIDCGLWSYLCFPLILLLGTIFTIRSKLLQIFKFPSVIATFLEVLKKQDSKGQQGTHPIKVFFTSIGGCIGVGNIVTVCIAVQVGGPGALFWIWVGGFLGMVIKYSEVFLGIKYRVKNSSGGYDGGPMYFLPKAFPKMKWVASLAAFLLCIYGTEVFMFRVMVESVSENWHINRAVVVVVMLLVAFYSVKGGIERVGGVCSAIIPVFFVIYIFMSVAVLTQHSSELLVVLQAVFTQAFTGKAALTGGAAGGFLLMAKEGIERGCYSGDIGIGYASIVHAETQLKDPKKQAKLAIFGIFLDTFVICTLSVLVTLVTGVWENPAISAGVLVQEALATRFSHMELFIPFFLLLLGFSTVIAFFIVGSKCARFLSPKRGEKIYYIYALVGFLVFSLPQMTTLGALSLMQITGGLLLVINIIGIFRLRKQIDFSGSKEL
jgi:alanine or glycine:cation symporter, AGCS family